MTQPFDPSNLSDTQVLALKNIVGDAYVSVGIPERLIHSRDMWPRTVLWTKRGHFPHPPDAVVSPENTKQVSELLKWASSEKVPIIAYGAGSGVCAGILPIKGGIIVSTKRMDALVNIDAESLVAEIEPGIYGETLERRLAALGYTMGHYPSSIYCSTLGGYLAARSAGQVSSRYGKIEDMVVALEFVLPDGSIHRTHPSPTAASRIDWNQILIGSEGTLGIITKAWMRIHPVPKTKTFQSYHFPNIKSALDAMRKIMQAGVEPSVLRLYDAFDTLVFSTHGAGGATEDETTPTLLQSTITEAVLTLKKRSLSPLLKRAKWVNKAINSIQGKCLVIIITEGEQDLAEHEAWQIRTICLDSAGKNLGEAPARYWLEHRHDVSYKMSKIFDADCWVDTIEVATTWGEVSDLYNAVKNAVAPDAFIMAHFSHAYRDGCCIYFSMASSASDAMRLEENYNKVWKNALYAVHKNKGTITHHHGVGMSKGAMLPTEYGDLWPLWRKVKDTLDPDKVMNPGKLGDKI